MPRVLSRTPRPDGLTAILVDVDGVKRATVLVPTITADLVTAAEVEAMVKQGVTTVRPPLRR